MIEMTRIGRLLHSFLLGSPDSKGKPASEHSECGLVMDGGTVGGNLQKFALQKKD
ncbi:hypothetical protein [Pedobacter chitinilyticus]|uniref:hypothetical protein n=1 Tax=Pedobacter chitinilyticus TaxID=2233776 RepID=UPI0019690A81|nr:hypothetical protein [Pedobacter chitinilyticus]